MAQQTQSVICPRPTRAREDDQIVEMFLHVYQDGRFAHKVEWLPQQETNVEAIASAENGTRLAIEHTRLFDEFAIGRHLNQGEDPILADVCAHLEDIPLPVSDRVFGLSVDPKHLKILLTKKYRPKTLEALAGWAQRYLPPLYENREFEILVRAKLPRKTRTARIGVEVWKVGSNHPILGCGYPPPRSEIAPLVRKAFEDKLPKLSSAQADRRILMLELVTLDSDSKVYGSVCKLATEFPQFLTVDELVFVRGLPELGAVFRTWNTGSNEWSVVIARVNEAFH